MAASAFPFFSGGDVELRFNRTDPPWKLHSFVLSLHSPLFKASLSDRWNQDGNASQTSARQFWAYELRFEKRTGEGTFVKAATCSPKSEMLGDDDFVTVLRDERRDACSATQDTLRAIYHQPLTSLVEHSRYSAAAELLCLCEAAQFYDCMHILKPYIEVHAYEYSSQVASTCLLYCGKMLCVAAMTKISRLFTLAAPAIIGLWQESWEDQKPLLDHFALRGIFEIQRERLIARLKTVEADLLEMGTLDCSASGITHVALDLWRTWINEQIADGNGSSLRNPEYSRLYIRIARYRKANVGVHRDILQYHDSSRSQFSTEDLLAELEKILLFAKKIVAPILIDSRDGFNARFRSGTLLFMNIGQYDLLWPVEIFGQPV